jgi:Cell division control protein 14, SIN component
MRMLQVLLDFLSVSRHVPHTTAQSPHSKSPSPPSLATAVLDTLLCVLVDAPVALRSFEEVNGVETVVKTLKRAGVEKDVR